MSTWRDVFRARIAEKIANARARGLDAAALFAALKNPYRSGWLAQVWSDERARQLGREAGRIPPRRGTRAAAERSARIGGAQPTLPGFSRVEGRAAVASVDERVRAALARQGPVTAETLAAGLGINRNTVRRVLREHVRAGVVVETGRDGEDARARLYALAEGVERL